MANLVIIYRPKNPRRFVYCNRGEAPSDLITYDAELIGQISKRAIPMIFWSREKMPYFHIIFSSKTIAKNWLKENHPELKLGTNIYWDGIINIAQAKS